MVQVQVKYNFPFTVDAFFVLFRPNQCRVSWCNTVTNFTNAHLCTMWWLRVEWVHFLVTTFNGGVRAACCTNTLHLNYNVQCCVNCATVDLCNAVSTVPCISCFFLWQRPCRPDQRTGEPLLSYQLTFYLGTLGASKTLGPWEAPKPWDPGRIQMSRKFRTLKQSLPPYPT